MDIYTHFMSQNESVSTYFPEHLLWLFFPYYKTLSMQLTGL